MTPEEELLRDRIAQERTTPRFTDKLKRDVLAYLATQGHRRASALYALQLTEAKVAKWGTKAMWHTIKRGA